MRGSLKRGSTLHTIGFNATLKVSQGQGLKVKGQGQICNYVKKLSWA